MSAITYEVCVCELAFNGAHGFPRRTSFTGKGARAKALQFARQEFSDRGATTITSIQVRRLGGRAPGSGVELLRLRNESPICPCSNADCRRERHFPRPAA